MSTLNRPVQIKHLPDTLQDGPEKTLGAYPWLFRRDQAISPLRSVEATVSESDSFINEVTEEVRRDRLFRLFRRYGWIAAVLVVLVVGGASVNEWRKAQAISQAQALGDSLFAALESGKPQSRAAAVQGVTAEAEAAALRDFMAASETASFDAAAAAALLEQIAAMPDIRQVYRDLAVLRLTMLQDFAMFSDEKLTRLEPLTAPGAPLRLSALEQIAYVHAERNEPDLAVPVLRRIQQDAEASTDQRQRATDMIVALGGDATES
jgi:hypothetical protein